MDNTNGTPGAETTPADAARRNPALFLGASVALGFALARVGKTAIERSTDADTNEQYNPYTSATPGM